MPYKKKLIEVALPLEAINREAAREKSIRHGHPSTLHLWWARRPLAACRAVLFASLVDDPSAHPDRFPDEESQAKERQRLFEIIEALVKWENSNNEEVLAAARAEIMASCDGNPPPVLDPFAGGGSIPLEAQRLGLEAHASDLNPVAVLINKALIEIPPLFADRPPVHPDESGDARLKTWRGAQGLADDVRYYGSWMRDEAERRIGHLYPKVSLPPEHGGGEATVIAWIWARAVLCPNPACGARMPLVSSWALSTKKGKEAWVDPQVDSRSKAVHYSIGTGPGGPPPSPKQGKGAKFACVVCGEVAPDRVIYAAGMAKEMSADLMAIVAEGSRSRVYLPPTEDHISAANAATPTWRPSGEMPANPRWFSPPAYGMTTWGDLFTVRQLVALTTFSDLVAEARDKIRADALAAGLPDDPTALRDHGTGATAYAEAVSVYLAFAISKVADRGSTICTWFTDRDSTRNTFARQAIPMTWDFAEMNTLTTGTGSLRGAVDWTAESIEGWQIPQARPGYAAQRDAAAPDLMSCAVSTDPPYYDNIGYADLSDFFYVWLRRSLGSVYPDECSTLLVPKTQELVATPYRFGGDKRAAEEFFEEGLGRVFQRLRDIQDPRFPLTVYYAFKQAESTEGGTSSTGWETMLQSLLDSGLAVDGTWPMRSELSNRMIASGTNALASSIVLVCRPRDVTAALATRKEFVAALKAELPSAVRTMQQGNIAPVDLAQASIGPGMAVFSRYSKVVEADGQPMRVRTALELINQVLDETIAGTDADFDADTRWATTWFEDCGMNEGDFGRAEQLSKSRNTSVEGLAKAGIIGQRPGKVRLVPREELPADWDPTSDDRMTVWEITQHLIRRLEHDGEEAAAALLRQVGSGLGETAKELAYRLYLICDRKGWAKEATSYNGLVTAWPELTRLAALEPSAPVDASGGATLFEE